MGRKLTNCRKIAIFCLVFLSAGRILPVIVEAREQEYPVAINYDYRPINYSTPYDPKYLRIQNVKGEARREILLEKANEENSDAYALLSQEGLPEPLRRVAGQMDPSFMGGEYLPDLKKNESEIARIVMQSITRDVISIRARTEDDGNISYRIVDEYKTHYKLAIKSSTQPLSLSELIKQIDESWHGKDYQGLIFGFLQYTRDEVVVSFDELEEQYRNFFSVSSFYYPGLAEYYESKIAQWFKKKGRWKVTMVPRKKNSMNDDSRYSPMQCVGFFVEETGGKDYLLKTSPVDNDQQGSIAQLLESMDVKFSWYSKDVTTVFGNYTRALEVSRALKDKLGVDSRIFAGVFEIYFDPTTIPNDDGKRPVENVNPSQQKLSFGVLMSRGMAEFASERLEQERHDGDGAVP